LKRRLEQTFSEENEKNFFLKIEQKIFEEKIETKSFLNKNLQIKNRTKNLNKNRNKRIEKSRLEQTFVKKI
jgi:hypothetical protein